MVMTPFKMCVLVFKHFNKSLPFLLSILLQLIFLWTYLKLPIDICNDLLYTFLISKGEIL